MPSRTRKFTDAWIRSVKPPKTGQVDWTDTGITLKRRRYFGLRVSYGGTKAFWVRYPGVGKRFERLTLGIYPELSLADARELAVHRFGIVVQGGNPAADKRALKGAPLFTALNEAFEREHLAGSRERTQRRHRNTTAEFLDHWAALSIVELSDPDEGPVLLDKRIKAIKARGAPTQARAAWKAVNQLWRWGAKHHKFKKWLTHNPCDGVVKPAAHAARERTLNDGELRAMWAAYMALEGDYPEVFALLFYSAQRQSEVLALEWPDLDFAAADGVVWTCPPDKNKSKRTQVLPLPQPAADILIRRRHEAGDSTFVFPHPDDDKRPLRSIQNAHAAARTAAKVANFRAHDIRRTVATRMAGMRNDSGEKLIERVVIERVLNHGDPSVTATYDHHDYKLEKGEALSAWAAELECILKQDARAVSRIGTAQHRAANA